MGRHADPNRATFARSCAVAVMRALFAVGLAVGMTLALARIPLPFGPSSAVVLDTVDPQDVDEAPAPAPVPQPDEDGDGDGEAELEVDPPEEEDPLDIPLRERLGASPSPDAAPQEEGSPAPVTEIPQDAPAPEDTTVQVLDGAGDRGNLEDVVAVLEELGYDIRATNPALPYERTTILYTEGHEAAAEALQARDPRFGVIRPNENLSTEIDIHVVVGEDWEPAED